jgi:predicted amino acid-binding ACT domain protein
MRTRTQCELEITSALAAYRQAIDTGDTIGADLEQTVMDELLTLYALIPQQER